MDVIQQIADLGNEVVKYIQMLGIPASAIAFGIGGMQHIFGGVEGVRKAKPWYIGAAIGLIVILGATALASFIQSKVQF